MKLFAYDIADALGLPHPAVNIEIRHIVTDSREVRENTLFAALAGERVDGHDFIPALDQTQKDILFLTSRPMDTRNGSLAACIAVLMIQPLSLSPSRAVSTKRP